ncbi:MAG: DUF438 domain-containing protein [Chloroflexi bacterium]|nr:DUF438 domain-containing protein [Chloroflexota bacterium]
MTEGLGNSDDRKAMLKEMIRELHAGADPERVKEEFKEVLEGVTSVEIAKIEEELIHEGMPRQEIQRLCDVHLAVMRESLEKEKTLAPPGHPIHTLMEEHNILLQFAGKLREFAVQMRERRTPGTPEADLKQLDHFAEHFKESQRHYLREENVLFPYLEKHGIVEPPRIMWSEHNEIRSREKDLYALIDRYESETVQSFAGSLVEIASNLGDLLAAHFYKENNILFPAAMRVIPDNEWPEIRREADEIGYCCFTPDYAVRAAETVEAAPAPAPVIEQGKLQFDIGELTPEQIEGLFNALPVDVTFVDKDDEVRYFNKAEDRIFIRTKAVIGRKVADCHPQASLHKVLEIVESFKQGRRDKAEFWINYQGRFVYIVFYPVHDRNGQYLGTVEVVQDISKLKTLQGEKRLLDS